MPSLPDEPTAVELPGDAASQISTPVLSGKQWRQGLFWALLSPLFLGIIPIFAKIAYAAGANVLTVVAFRTLFAALLMWLGMLIFGRHLLRSSTFAILGSLIAGAINGVGSLFFYASLSRIDASMGQLINISYLVFVTLLLRIAGQRVSVFTFFRIGLTIFAIYLLTAGGLGEPDWIGVAMMVLASLTYAIQLVFSQRIMLDIPAPTMTLYAVSGMALVVTAAWLLFPTNLALVTAVSWRAILLMGFATALSRLTLFLGVKSLGSLQTALLNVGEVIVTITVAAVWLGEQLTLLQWLGALLIVISILLVRFERDVPKRVDWWHVLWRWLRWGK
jgi:drug/metabolite transporter (DMT)-like permease